MPVRTAGGRVAGGRLAGYTRRMGAGIRAARLALVGVPGVTAKDTRSIVAPEVSGASRRAMPVMNAAVVRFPRRRTSPHRGAADEDWNMCHVRRPRWVQQPGV